MARTLFVTGICILTITTSRGVTRPTASELLERYAANQDKFGSWAIKLDHTWKYSGESGQGRIEETYEIRADGRRMAVRSRSWGDYYIGAEPVPQSRARYDSRSWDGERHIVYWQDHDDPNNSGSGIINPNPPEHHIRSLQCLNPFSPMMGFCNPGVFDRIDIVVRKARWASIRDEAEQVNGVNCWVVEAAADSGNYTVWIDPEHGYNLAQVEVRMSAAAGHTGGGHRMQSGQRILTMRNTRFDNIGGAWLPVESDCVSRSTDSGHQEMKEERHIIVTEAVLNPDHNALHSFTHEDIRKGAHVSLYPLLHISYTWQDGELVPRFDADIVEQIDRTLATMLPKGIGEGEARGSDAGEPTARSGTVTDSPANVQPRAQHSQARPPLLSGPRPHCGLYCMYSLLRLGGRQVKYPDLIKPEYYGSRSGSSLAELRRAAHDYGLRVEIAERVSTRALRDAPCRAILHVKPNSEAREYNHYELFLGVEKGQARLFNPPDGPRLVSFRELAGLWDGSALLVSFRPFDMDVVCAADRQHLLSCWVAGAVVVLLAHIGRLLWSKLVGALPRRLIVRLTLGQGALLGVAALSTATVYHLSNDEGLLTNAKATASVQKAYTGTFIPRISNSEAGRLLRAGAVFIDARFTRDYERGHLEGAISLPVDTNDVLWKKTTASLPKNKHIVAYCQSAGCKFAETVSVRLMEKGFKDMSIYRGGWNDWVAKQKESRGLFETSGEDPNGGRVWIATEGLTSKS